MKFNVCSGALVALALLTVSPAQAAFIDEGGTGGGFRIVGKLNQPANAVGLGQKVTLREAIPQIVPADYSTELGQGMDQFASKRVSWRGGKPWTDVLADTVSTIPEVSVDINTMTRVVTLTAVSPRTQALGKSGQAAGHNRWLIRSGEKLSETVAAWGREAGWQGVYWEAPDLISDIDVSFDGSFEQALTDTVETLAKHGTQLRVVFYGGNKVVRILESK